MSNKKARIPKTCPSCGSAFEATQYQLDNGRGRYCSRPCSAKGSMIKHGHTTKTYASPTYLTWINMRRRCQDVKSTKYPQYGALGITVCSEWQSFEGFLSDMGVRPDGKTLDRINGDLGYTKDNCRWATPAEQSSNLKTTTWVEYNGVRVDLTSLSKSLGLSKGTLSYRIKAGWPESQWSRSATYEKCSRS